MEVLAATGRVIAGTLMVGGFIVIVGSIFVLHWATIILFVMSLFNKEKYRPLCKKVFNWFVLDVVVVMGGVFVITMIRDLLR